MLYCASYFQLENHHGQLLSISLSTPKGVEIGGHLDFFKPTQELLNWWKTSSQDELAWSEYTSQFWSILSDRKTAILDWIDALGQKPTQDMTLLCWEKKGAYCHRNLVARLLQKHCPQLFGGCDVPQFQVGDRVSWTNAYSYLTFLEPFEIRAIEGDRAYLQWMSSPVKLAELRRINVTQQEMKVITLWEPWASLIAEGLKEYETRSWHTDYRGKLAIHAAKRPVNSDECNQIVLNAPTTAFDNLPGGRQWFDHEFPVGCIVAVAELTDCLLMSNQSPKLVNENAGEIAIDGIDPIERAVGLWEPGRFAWKLERIQQLSEPLPVKGKQGLWNAPEELKQNLRKIEC